MPSDKKRKPRKGRKLTIDPAGWTIIVWMMAIAVSILFFAIVEPAEARHVPDEGSVFQKVMPERRAVPRDVATEHPDPARVGAVEGREDWA